MKKKKWIIAQGSREVASEIGAKLGLEKLAARVLSARGVESAEQAAEFLNTSLSCLHDPYLMDDMAEAVGIIEQSISNGEKIAVYGDYDVDGVTATCILIKYLRKRSVECTYYIPDRLGEGYGLNSVALQGLYDDGCRLLITVDSGITATQEAVFAKQIGLKLIITDHHECKEELPCAQAIVNPRRQGGGYPFRELAGVGVAFKLICALERDVPIEQLINEYGDIVAVGTIADVMPIVGENRSIVAHGLRILQNTKNLGLRALMCKLGLEDKPISSNSVSFVMAPRINAAGRMGGASGAAQMFLTDDWNEACELAEHLCELNRMRQEEENGIYTQIAERLEREPQLAKDKMLVLWGDDWHNGVIGIVASRLADKYGVPCILISMTEDRGKGSGRSIKGFNLYAALEKNASQLEKYGGHELAVGLSVSRDKLESFKLDMCAFAEAVSSNEPVVPQVFIDCGCEPQDICISEIEGLSALEPFGMGNPQSCFVMQNVRLEEITPISRDRHIKMLLSKNGKSFYAFAFGMGAKSCPFVCEDILDIAFSAEINHYRGSKSVQLVIKDVRRSESEQEIDDSSFECYSSFACGTSLEAEKACQISPAREDLVALFRHIKSNAEHNTLCTSAKTLYRKVRYESRRNMNMGKLLVCMDVFEEFSIFSYDILGDEIFIDVLPSSGKVDINGSKILKRLLTMREA